MSREAQDKKNITTSIMKARQLMGKDLGEAEKLMRSIAPPVQRLDFCVFEFNQMYAMIKYKQDMLDDSLGYCDKALNLHKDDQNMWKLRLTIFIKKESKGTAAEMIKYFETCKPTEHLLTLIAPKVKEFNDDKLSDLFVEALKQMPIETAKKFASYIPETSTAIPLKISLMKEAAHENVEVCEDLIVILIDDKDFDEADKFIKLLPDDNEYKLYYETLTSSNVLDSAKRHIAQGKDNFKKFVESAEQGDVNMLRNEIQLIGNFPAGFLLLIQMVKDPKQKITIADEMATKFPRSIKILEAAAFAKLECKDINGSVKIIKQIAQVDEQLSNKIMIQVYIQSGRIQEAENLLKSGITISPAQRAEIDLEMYHSDGDVTRLRRILELEVEAKNAKTIAEAAFLLSKTAPRSEVEPYLVAAMKANREDPSIFAFYGRFLRSQGDEEKGVFLLAKAVSMGCADGDAVEASMLQMIAEGRLEEAAEVCGRVNEQWARQRAGLIYYRLNEFEKAANQLQAYLRGADKDANAWTVLGFCYIALGRALSALHVSEKLRHLEHQSIALDSQLDAFFGRPVAFPSGSSDPAALMPFTIQAIDHLRQFSMFGRRATCRAIVERSEGKVREFVEKWGTLSSVLKVAGDFFVEAFRATENDNYIGEAQALFMRRAEVDKRGEAFVDLASVLILRGMTEPAVGVLRRAVKAFPAHQGVWQALGIAYSLAGQFPFARHCLCVAAKMATEVEQASALAYCAAIAVLVEDEGLLEVATKAAHRLNPKDPLIWQLIALTSEDKLSATLNAFEFGPSPSTASTLVDLSIRNGRSKAAIGFALISGENALIERALEANGLFEQAALFTDDEMVKRRLLALQHKESGIEAADAFMKGDFERARAIFDEMDGPLPCVASAACNKKLEKLQEAVDQLEMASEVIVDSKTKDVVERLISDLTGFDEEGDPPKDAAAGIRGIVCDNGLQIGAGKAFKMYPGNELSTKLLAAECAISNDVPPTEVVKAPAAIANLSRNNHTRENIALTAMMHIRGRMIPEALNSLQTLCLLSPADMPRIMPLIQTLREKL